MNKLKKSLAVAVILLFIGVAFSSSINVSVVKASNDNELVEVTTEVCGIKGYGNTTVKLTKEQYQNLEQYLVEFRARLNQTTTKEEAVPILKEAIVELGKYGLLGNLTIEQAENIIFFWYRDSIITKKLDSKTNKNLCCIVTGRVNRSIAVHRFNSWICWTYCLLGRLAYIIYNQHPDWIALLLPLIPIWFLAMVLSYYIGWSWEYLADNNRIAFFDVISVGYDLLYTYHKYGNGWVNSIGLLGVKKWNGEFMGNLPGFKIPAPDDATLYYPGIWAFNGIQINMPEIGDKYFLGSALAVGFDVKQ